MLIVSISKLTLVFLLNVFPNIYYLIIPTGFETDILLLAFVNGLMLTNYNLLLGKKRIKIYNIIFTLQILTLISVLVYLIYVDNIIGVESWVNAAYFAYSVGFITSFIAIISKIGKLKLTGITSMIIPVFKFGLITQIANILHIGNKRISFYFLKSFTGIKSVGLYGAGTQLTEGLRLIGQSISMVQFSEISNTNNKDFAISITIKLMKFSIILTSIAVVILIIIPTSVYTAIFSSEFNDLKLIIVALSPGVIALSINTIFSHYFSGLGRPIISLWANLIGIIITIILALVLIPLIGSLGAAITASASYISTIIYQYQVFKKDTGVKWHDWIPDKNDINDLRQIIKSLTKQ